MLYLDQSENKRVSMGHTSGKQAVYRFCFPLVRVPLLYELSEVFQLQVCPKAPPSPHFSHLLQRAAVHILQNLILLWGRWLVGFRRSEARCGVFLRSITFTCLQAVIYWPSSDAHSSETEMSHSFCCLAWSLNACTWSTHMQITKQTRCKCRELQLSLDELVQIHTAGTACSRAFKQFLWNQTCVAVFNFPFNVNEVLSSIYMRAFKSHYAGY